ncbi:hypothetical protein [Aquipuribacter sp. SD81]|uniref:hypothetical protein n=1 Tax=Aquipuribacter sp. SD81 TaxID=3127703 RepID=UPI003018466F
MAAADVPRHEGSSFEPVPRAPQDTARPYPPEAAPVSPEPDTEPAQVTGEQTDPLPRELHTDNTRPGDDAADEPTPAAAGTTDDGTEPPD